jgi:hypothetical protein
MSDLRQGVTPVVHEVLDAVDNLRRAGDPPGKLRNMARAVLSCTPGNAPARRISDVTAAACLILAAELDEEAGS